MNGTDLKMKRRQERKKRAHSVVSFLSLSNIRFASWDCVVCVYNDGSLEDFGIWIVEYGNMYFLCNFLHYSLRSLESTTTMKLLVIRSFHIGKVFLTQVELSTIQQAHWGPKWNRGREKLQAENIFGKNGISFLKLFHILYFFCHSFHYRIF